MWGANTSGTVTCIEGKPAAENAEFWRDSLAKISRLTRQYQQRLSKCPHTANDQECTASHHQGSLEQDSHLCIILGTISLQSHLPGLPDDCKMDVTRMSVATKTA